MPKVQALARVHCRQTTYRLVPSHFPPIQLFENLLDPGELEAAYALEAITNDRLRDLTGDISLVAPEERVVGAGTSPIMAAFTHIGVPSRFTTGRFGIYYAGLELETALKEAVHSRSRFLRATNEAAQEVTLRCYRCKVDAALVDVRARNDLHHPDNYAPSQIFGTEQKRQNENGILYRSVRNPGGECVALLRPKALVPPARQGRHYRLFWDGEKVERVVEFKEVKF
ncbi:RES family NAD+ phosphorylase [Marinimicrobium alkaliphilum]|uniref:RES family NAD+ phosphorylase n=1 Tax=Marinimicrobium alkaliphilum TaxID=2202654 RepID=UPI000DBA8E3A|nr:RES family NAD+ phosphorylase [Marinimicrobium alkaliphilum]